MQFLWERSSIVFGVVLFAGSLTCVSVDTASALQATLRWSNKSTEVSGFRIERKTGMNGTYSEIATISADETSYIDANLSTRTTYCYRISAYNNSGNSLYSNEMCQTTSATLTTAKYWLSLSLVGKGRVTSSPVGISCATDCVESYTSGTQVVLNPRAPSGWQFAGWGGSCAGQSETCVLTMSDTKNVTANFAPQ